jgi:uncharacterized cupredoxin-like copper-binding protein
MSIQLLMKSVFVSGLGLTMCAAAMAGATDDHDHGTDQRAQASHAHESDFGKPGSEHDVHRTIELTLGDISFDSKEIVVEDGETVRFVLRNQGQLLHEFNIGTPDLHEAHQREMLEMFERGMMTATGTMHHMNEMDHSKMGGMTHDDPNAVLVDPGQTRELIWTFTRTARLEFACNIPGHYQSGMFGPIRFR